MNIEEIIKELIFNKIIHNEPTEYKQLIGGTVSELYLLKFDGFKYVVKLNEPKVIESEAKFLNYYNESNLLPKLLFAEQSYKYIVYSYINGSTNYDRKNKKQMLKVLVQGLLNNYKSSHNDFGWGWADQPVDTWQNFLMDEIIETKKILDSRLDIEEYNFVYNLIKKTTRVRKSYLLHGDCGVHNFIFNDGELFGVIDPTPVIGDPIYDLIYAFCSSPDDLTRETIDSAVSHLMIKKEKNIPFLYEEVIIGLYLRLGTCIKHHPHDFEEYLKAWYYWKDLIMNVEL